MILYKDTLYAAITGERLDIKCEHARSCATTRRLLVRLIETIVPEVLYHVISAEDPAHDGQVLKQVLKKAGQSGMDDTLGGYLAWAMSNQRAELVSSPVTDKGGKLLALLLPPRTISCYLESFLDRTVDGLGGGPDAVPAWLHLIGETTVVCLAQLNAAGTRQIVYKTRGHVQLETFEGLVKRVGEWRKERAKAGGRSAVKPKKGEKPAKDPIRLLLSIYEGMKGALFPLATVERGSGAPPFASRLILMGDETEVPQTKLFESWFRAQNSSQAVPFLAHEYQSLVLALLSNRNEPGTYLAWTKLAADDWSGNGAWISYLDSVARSRSVRSSDGSVPSDKDRWMALDKTRLRYAIEGFSNSAALELDDLSRRKRQGISLTKEDSVRRRQIEATKQSIVSLLGAFPRRGSVILSLLKFALRLLFILVVVIFFASVLTTAFPWLTRIRLRKDAPLVVDLQECRGIHGRSWCWAKDKAGVVFEASRQGLSSIVEPVYEPIYEAHVKPVYDEYALPLVRRAGQYLPKVQEAVSPFATVAGAGVVYGVKWLEEAVDAIVQSGKDMDWQRLYSATARVASGTVDVAGRASVEIWAAAKPLVVSSAERTREAVGDAYLRLMRVPSIAEAAAKFDQHVGQPSGKLWTQVKPRLQHAAELGRKGTKMAYLVIVRKQPKSPDETWESKIETESFVRDVGAAWTWSKEKAAASMDPALDNLASVHQATKEGWHKFVSWLEDSVGLEFGEWEDEIEVGFSDDEDDEEPASDPLSPPLVTEASTADVGDSGKVDGQDVGTVKSDADKGAEEQGVEQGQSEEQVQEERTGEPQIAVPMDEPDSSSEQESAGADSAHVASQQFDNVASEPERRPFEDVEVVTESAEHDFAEPASSDSSDQERVHTSDQGESIPPPKSEAEDGILDEDSMGQMGTEAEAGVVGHGQGDHDTQSVPAGG